MKNTTATATPMFVLGNNANVAVRVKAYYDNQDLYLALVQEGNTVGILPNAPVNKKANILEAEMLVKHLNETVVIEKQDQIEEEDVSGMKTIQMVQAEIEVVEEGIVQVAKLFDEGKIKHTQKIAQTNRLMHQIEDLRAEQVQIVSRNNFVNPISEAARAAARFQWAEKAHVVGKAAPEATPIDRAYRNASVGSFQKHAIETANARFRDLGEYQVTVIAIAWFPKPDRNNRLGKLVVQIPFGYAEIKYWDRNAPQAERMQWHEFTDYNLDQFKSEFNPPVGTGLLTLAIRQGKDGQLYVSLPKSVGKTPGLYYDKMHVRDVRFGKAVSDNNRNLESALTSYLRFFVNEFKQANPVNRHGIEEHCGSCKFNMYVPGYDGMDNEVEGYKNTLNTNDTIEMVQWGQDIPRRFCMINHDLVDLDIIKDINEAAQSEVTTWFDAEGKMQWLKPGEVVLNGRGIHRYQAIKQGTMERCGACPHYHNNSPKSDEQITKEVTAKRIALGNNQADVYVSKYWSESARSERMAIQTLTQTSKGYEWINEYPGVVDSPIEFRVYGIGGTVVYGSEAVNEAAAMNGVLDIIPMMEEVNQAELKGAKVVNIIHQTCNRIADVTPANLEAIFIMMQKKPEGISERMATRWDNAVERLIKTLEEARNPKVEE
jgi:hypothetical protein